MSPVSWLMPSGIRTFSINSTKNQKHSLITCTGFKREMCIFFKLKYNEWVFTWY